MFGLNNKRNGAFLFSILAGQPKVLVNPLILTLALETQTQEFGQFILRKIIKMLPPDVRFKG